MESMNLKKKWLTKFEITNQRESPDYNESIKYFQKFVDETHFAKMFTMGISPQGREIKYIVVTKGKEFTPAKAAKSGKAIVLIQNGIHPGEIAGKDASMILLREILITKEKEHLLKNIILLIIPVFNVDGHERLSPFNRPNQAGPLQMGWRTNALNLNLNRDYTKADAPEMKAWLKFFNEWQPDFMIDNHATNGADYQYHITYGIGKHENVSPYLSTWVKESFYPELISKVESDGFLTAPYIEFKNEESILDGIFDQPSLPRFSNGYPLLHNRLCLLVETHSLKTFANRVFSTLSTMTHTISYLNENYKELKLLNKKAEEDTLKEYLKNKKPFPINFIEHEKPEKFLFKGFRSIEESSEITGNKILKYTDKPVEFYIPNYNKSTISDFVNVPEAYLIPKQFSEIVEIIKLHRIDVEALKSEKKFQVEKYKFAKVKFWSRPYEGRLPVNFEFEKLKEKTIVEKGTFVISTNQKALRVILFLLEPASQDSFVRWGFFNAFFERKEYAEPFIMEPIAKKMLQERKSLWREFYNRVEIDEEFRNNAAERLDFFYQRSPYFDKGEKVYPVMRVVK